MGIDDSFADLENHESGTPFAMAMVAPSEPSYHPLSQVRAYAGT
jgi:hypothetical protein